MSRDDIIINQDLSNPEIAKWTLRSHNLLKIGSLNIQRTSNFQAVFELARTVDILFLQEVYATEKRIQSFKLRENHFKLRFISSKVNGQTPNQTAIIINPAKVKILGNVHLFEILNYHGHLTDV